ncbi:MAG TPA: hypothetical protein VGC46_14985, partial [Allosphingosinicella sp.]
MFELIGGLFLIGLIALFVSNRALAARIEELERKIGAGAVAAVPAPTPEPEPAAPRPADMPEEQPRPAVSGPLPVSFANLFESLIGGSLLIWVGAI